MGKTLLLMNVRWPTDRYYIKKICEENNQILRLKLHISLVNMD